MAKPKLKTIEEIEAQVEAELEAEEAAEAAIADETIEAAEADIASESDSDPELDAIAELSQAAIDAVEAYDEKFESRFGDQNNEGASAAGFLFTIFPKWETWTRAQLLQDINTWKKLIPPVADTWEYSNADYIRYLAYLNHCGAQSSKPLNLDDFLAEYC